MCLGWPFIGRNGTCKDGKERHSRERELSEGGLELNKA